MLLLAPSEYTGEPKTGVVGRVVLFRGPIDIGGAGGRVAAASSSPPASAGRGRGKAKGRAKIRDGPQQKCEVHLLGGETLGEVLYVEAWADVARELKDCMEIGKVYCISGAQYVTQKPRYSTSRLPYFLRVQGPVGTRTKVQSCSATPWKDLPMHHPFSDVASLGRVEGSLQVCLAGVISHQPGLVSRETQHGPGEVCNAVLRQNSTDIRCAFWRSHAAALADFSVGAKVVLMQVNVCKHGDSFEVRATEATEVRICPEDVAATDLAGTQDDQTAVVSLTQTLTINYDEIPATRAAVSAIAGIIAPQAPRAMTGVYEMHNAAVVGVASAVGDDQYQMEACRTCKRRVEEGVCSDHPGAGTERRWFLSLTVADASGQMQVALYHDVAATLPFLPEDATKELALRRMVRAFRAPLWSMRVVFKTNDYLQNNYVEVKRMVHTITREGVVATYRGGPPTQGFEKQAAPAQSRDAPTLNSTPTSG